MLAVWLGDAPSVMGSTCRSTHVRARSGIRSSWPAESESWCGLDLAGCRFSGRDVAPRARRTEAQVRLPPDLAGPVEVEPARLTEYIPAPASMPGGARYEPKFDGYLH